MDNDGELLTVLIESILFFAVDMYIEVLDQLRWNLLVSDPSRWALCRLDLWRFWEEIFLPGLVIVQALLAVLLVSGRTDCTYPYH